MRFELFCYLRVIFNARPDKHSETTIGSEANSKWIKFGGNYSILVLCSQNILTISPFQLTWKLKLFSSQFNHDAAIRGFWCAKHVFYSSLQSIN